MKAIEVWLNWAGILLSAYVCGRRLSGGDDVSWIGYWSVVYGGGPCNKKKENARLAMIPGWRCRHAECCLVWHDLWFSTRSHVLPKALQLENVATLNHCAKNSEKSLHWVHEMVHATRAGSLPTICEWVELQVEILKCPITLEVNQKVLLWWQKWSV